MDSPERSKLSWDRLSHSHSWSSPGHPDPANEGTPADHGNRFAERVSNDYQSRPQSRILTPNVSDDHITVFPIQDVDEKSNVSDSKPGFSSEGYLSQNATGERSARQDTSETTEKQLEDGSGESHAFPSSTDLSMKPVPLSELSEATVEHERGLPVDIRHLYDPHTLSTVSEEDEDNLELGRYIYPTRLENSEIFSPSVADEPVSSPMNVVTEHVKNDTTEIALLRQQIQDLESRLAMSEELSRHRQNALKVAHHTISQLKAYGSSVNAMVTTLHAKLKEFVPPPVEPSKPTPRKQQEWIGGSWLAMASEFPELRPIEQAFASGLFQKALLLASKLMDDFDRSNLVRLYALILHAVILRSAGDSARATVNLCQSLKMALEWGNSDTGGLIYFQLGLCFFYEDRPTEASICLTYATGTPGYEQLVQVHAQQAMSTRESLVLDDPRRAPSAKFTQLMYSVSHLYSIPSDRVPDPTGKVICALTI